MTNENVSDFNRINGKNAKLYQKFFANNDFVTTCLTNNQIYKTWWTGKGVQKYSDSSCSFVDTKDKTKEELREDTIKTLTDIFGLDKEIFNKKFNEATKNNMLELRRISTLHSSSLIALLCFYKICNDQKLSFIHDGITFEFNECYFESKNQVGKGYSNVDIKLIGTADGEPAILFLESKFSEYLTPQSFNDDSVKDKVYGDIYNQLTNFEQNKELIKGIFIQHDSDRDCWVIIGKEHYCEGIKQMISHFKGINALQKPEDTKHLYLGEILFDFKNQYHQELEDYSKLYKPLSNTLNKLEQKKADFDILPTILTYQQIFDGKKSFLDSNVFNFYQFKA